MGWPLAFSFFCLSLCESVMWQMTEHFHFINSLSLHSPWTPFSNSPLLSHTLPHNTNKSTEIRICVFSYLRQSINIRPSLNQQRGDIIMSLTTAVMKCSLYEEELRGKKTLSHSLSHSNIHAVGEGMGIHQGREREREGSEWDVKEKIERRGEKRRRKREERERKYNRYIPLQRNIRE